MNFDFIVINIVYIFYSFFLNFALMTSKKISLC